MVRNHRRWRPQWKLFLSLFVVLTLLQVLWTLHFLREHVVWTMTFETPTSSSVISTKVHTYRASDASTRAPAKRNAKGNKLRLRFDWTNLDRLSPLAQRIAAHQSNCSAPLANFRFRNRFGLGSDLHVYSQAICNALEAGNIRVRTATPWIWLDTTACAQDTTSAMTCYFPESELRCANDRVLTPQQENELANMTRGRGKIKNACPSIRAEYDVSDIRAATTEFIFTRVSIVVQHEAERQLQHVFGDVVPKNLITVHIRWGDKADEMTLLPVSDYIEAVERILYQRRNDNLQWSDDVHIFLATEDPRALEEFQEAAPSTWKIYIDQYFREMTPYRRASYNGSPLMSQDLGGRPGLVALGSLLVAMEANDFVLTTASNWSRLMNELRRYVLDPRCHNCTRLVDLKYGEW
jgi:hypothetical protein